MEEVDSQAYQRLQQEAIALRQQVQTLEQELASWGKGSAKAEREELTPRAIAILQGSTEAFFSLNREWVFTYLNPQAESLLGRSRADLVGKNIWEEFAAAVGSLFYQQYHLAMESQKLVNFEAFYPPLEMWYDVRAYRVGEELFVYFTNINALKQLNQSNQALYESEQRFRTLIENVPGAIYRCAGDSDWTMEFISDAIAEISGYPASDFINNTARSFASIIHPEDVAEVEANIFEAIAAKTAYILEYRIICSDGAIRWVYEKGQGIFDEGGQFLYLDGVIFDISDRKHAEAELHQTRHFLSSVLENLPVGVAVKEAQDLRFVFWNPAAATLLGYQPEDVMGKNDRDLFPPEQAAEFIQKDREVLASHSTLEIPEEIVQTKFGDTRILRTLKAAILDRQGNPQYLLAIIEDITERKQAEKLLKQRIAAIEATTDGISVLNVDREYIYLNKAFCRIYGYESADELLGKTWRELYNRDEIERISRVILPIVDEKGQWHGEARGKMRDGVEFPQDISLTLTDFGLICVCRDIRDRKAAEEALRQSEQRFRDVSEAAGEYLWEIDLKGVYTFVSDKVKRVKGYDPAQVLGHNLFEFMLQEEVERVRAIVQEARSRQGNFKLEHRNITSSGEIVWEEVNGVPLLDETREIIGFRGTGLSITERKRAELQLRQKTHDLEQALHTLKRAQSQLLQSEKMSGLGQMVAGVAHEINNPVNFIHGNLNPANDYATDLLHLIELYQQHYPDPPEVIQGELDAIDLDFLKEDLTKLLRSMRVGTERIREIVMSLRNFSRLDEADFKPANIHEGLHGTLMILRNRLKATTERPEIEIIKDYGDLPRIECYPGQLNQVFMNIIANAIDAVEARLRENVEPQPGCIWISTEVLDTESVCIRIRDNGSGISEEIEHRIFDPFFTTKEVGKGTGLGMSISYQIVCERHNGLLECVSSLGEGTEFIVTLPLQQGRDRKQLLTNA
ncbi:PAS domain S-box protein [Lusitaniella coriacea]|uniref:PAS domain-containing sensor histidine kinase n=1 Tax=Lusitaniella coriacea TaxID=1983105 RepID=UPI003CEAA2A1